jgi:hypothetical protein
MIDRDIFSRRGCSSHNRLKMGLGGTWPTFGNITIPSRTRERGREAALRDALRADVDTADVERQGVGGRGRCR